MNKRTRQESRELRDKLKEAEAKYSSRKQLGAQFGISSQLVTYYLGKKIKDTVPHETVS